MARRAIFAITAAAVVLAGCGGDDAGDSGPPPAAEDEAPSKAEFIKEADSLCRKANRRAARLIDREQALYDSLGDVPTEPQLRKTFAQIRDTIDDRIRLRAGLTEQLEGLQPPSEGGPDRYMRARRRSSGSLRQHSANLRNYVRSLSETEAAAVDRTAKRATAASERERNQARAYGLKQCGGTRR